MPLLNVSRMRRCGDEHHHPTTIPQPQQPRRIPDKIPDIELQVRALFSSKLEGADKAVEGVRLVRDKATLVGKGFGYVLLTDRALAAAVSEVLRTSGRFDVDGVFSRPHPLVPKIVVTFLRNPMVRRGRLS